jgi:hypothetical protein
MSNSPQQAVTGRCQCGAVSYRIAGPIEEPALCHCRMCQRQFGSYFAALGNVNIADIVWTGDKPTLYRSSAAAERGFCRSCGTPMTFQYDSEPTTVSIALATLDNPAAVRPQQQDGIESRLPWLRELAGLPAATTEDSTPAELLAAIAGSVPRS